MTKAEALFQLAAYQNAEMPKEPAELIECLRLIADGAYVGSKWRVILAYLDALAKRCALLKKENSMLKRRLGML